MRVRAIRYQTSRRTEWNAFVEASRNGTFLFDRNYMDYHADRFDDASFMIERDGKLVALFPANQSSDTLTSHGGLTYGGLILPVRHGALATGRAFDALITAARADGFRRIVYKTIPAIFHKAPAEDDRYALFRKGARLIRADAWSVLPPGTVSRPSKNRSWEIRKARLSQGVRVGVSAQWDAFWQVLTHRLHDKHGATPTHSLAEIQLLASRFPDHMSLLTAEKEGAVLAGAVLYDCGRVLHTQYLAANATGRSEGLLSLVIDHAIRMAHEKGQTLSFGTSTEDNGRALNEGLIRYKESFGARMITHDFYELDIG